MMIDDDQNPTCQAPFDDAAALAMRRIDAIARPFPNVRSFRLVVLAELRQHFRKEMRSRRRQDPLITEDLAGIDVQHMRGVFVIELIDLTIVFFREIDPFHLVDEHTVSKATGLFHLIARQVLIFRCNDVDHLPLID